MHRSHYWVAKMSNQIVIDAEVNHIHGALMELAVFGGTLAVFVKVRLVGSDNRLEVVRELVAVAVAMKNVQNLTPVFSDSSG